MKQFDAFRLDTSNECLWRGAEQLALPPKPFAVLRYLVEHPGRLITHDELLDALWPETYVQPQVLRTYMLDLRKILKDDAGQPRFIQTLPKRGYCFVAPVTDWAAPAPAPAQSHLQPVARATARASAVASPEPLGIVDRVEEFAALTAQLDLASSGQRRVVFVTGEAGIGKTALVDAFCRQFEIRRQNDPAQTATVARGQCVEGFGGKEDYYPVVEALRQLCASAEGERACRVLTRIAPVWLAAVGRECEPGSGLAGRERMPGDLCAALEELAAEQPLILVFEDLHWADDATLHLISALARRRAAARLMVLATCRPRQGAREASGNGTNGTNGKSEHPLKALRQDLVLRRLCIEILLAPLARAAVGELLCRELEQKELPAGLARFVHRRSEGNPLFVIAIVEHLTSQRFLVRKKAASAAGTPDGPTQWEQRVTFEEMQEEMEASAPDGLTQMIESEMERLSPQEQRILEAGSLIRIAFPAWAVAAALGEDAAEIEEACDALARRLYFVQRGGQDELPDGTRSAFYVFAHELYREVLYQRQTETRRARRHVRIAERLGALFVEREASVAREMAMHFEAAGEWRRALHALRAAANHAQQRQADTEAAELLEHALRIAANLPEAEQVSITHELQSQLANSCSAVADSAASNGKTSPNPSRKLSAKA